MTTVTPHWKLRRLASRAARVAKRRKTESPAIAAFEQTIVPKSEKYSATYDECMKFAARWKKEMSEGRSSVAALLKQIQMWAPLLKRDVPGFDGTTYGDQPQVPDDVIEDGERMASVIDEFRDNQGNPLPYQKPALDEFGPALQAAVKEWAEAEAADSEYQRLLAAVRTQADDLQLDLVAFRRSLLATVGRADKDYQKLRSERAGVPDEDDDPNSPTPPKPVVAAPAGGPAQATT
jgi:hypothetical protein